MLCKPGRSEMKLKMTWKMKIRENESCFCGGFFVWWTRCEHKGYKTRNYRTNVEKIKQNLKDLRRSTDQARVCRSRQTVKKRVWQNTQKVYLDSVQRGFELIPVWSKNMWFALGRNDLRYWYQRSERGKTGHTCGKELDFPKGSETQTQHVLNDTSFPLWLKLRQRRPLRGFTEVLG